MSRYMGRYTLHISVISVKQNWQNYIYVSAIYQEYGIEGILPWAKNEKYLWYFSQEPD